HDIDLIVAESVPARAVERATFDKALSWGKGAAKVLEAKGRLRGLASTGSCPTCGLSAGEIDPRLFSFNTSQGQCAVCEGYGWVERVRKVRKGRGASASSRRPSRSEPEYEVIEEECTACGGSRLAPLPRSVRLEGMTYPELSS